ncbi:hypothetical protein GCM10018966_041660 [Streptomyces yanii]
MGEGGFWYFISVSLDGGPVLPNQVCRAWLAPRHRSGFDHGNERRPVCPVAELMPGANPGRYEMSGRVFQGKEWGGGRRDPKAGRRHIVLPQGVHGIGGKGGGRTAGG